MPDNWYGQVTNRMRNILNNVYNIRWFALAPDDQSRGRLATLVEHHLETLSKVDAELGKFIVPTTILLEGGWDVLHKDCWGIDPYNPWGDRWNVTDQSLGRVVRNLRQIVMSNSEARHLLRPPLWPLEGNPDVCGYALVADPAVLKRRRDLTVGGRDWCVAWGLLCKAEIAVWNALLWELAAGVGAIQEPNPFQDLLDLYQLGVFPMGCVGYNYELYVAKISTNNE